MRRLFSSTGLPSQGAVPRDFDDPDACLSVPLQPPVTPPGCSTWQVTDNSYGALPKAYPLSVDRGGTYHTFFGSVTFTAGATWTNLWSQLSAAQRVAITETGCYCNNEGSALPTMTLGTPRPPQVTPLPFFWMPPPDPTSFADIVLPENPVEESLPGNCCPGTGEAPRIEVEVVEVEGDQKLQFKLITRRPQEFRFRGDDQSDLALLQNGFPRFCCGEDPCDASKTVNRFIEYKAWLQDDYNPYGDEPKEPLGVIPTVMDVQYDRSTGTLGMVFAHTIVHTGRIVDVNWDTDCPHSEGYSYGDAVTEPGVDLAYNEDWRGNELIPINPIEGGACGNHCDQTNANCTPTCNADAIPEGYVLVGEYDGNDATEAAATAAAIAAAEAAAPLSIFCYVEQVGEGAYHAVAMGCEPE